MHVCTMIQSSLIARLRTLPSPDASTFLKSVNDCPKCADKLLNMLTESDFSGRYPAAAKAVLNRVLAISRLVASPYDLAFALCVFAEMNSLWSNYEAAESAFTEALSIATKHSEAEGLIESTYVNLANVQQDRGRLQEARDTLLSGLEYVRTQHNQRGQAEILGNLANIHQDLHDYERAITARKESLDLYDRLGDREAKTEGLSNLALIYADAGDIPTAVATCQKAIAMLDQVGASSASAQALNNLGTILRASGELDGAKLAFQAAASSARRAGDLQLSKIAAQNLSDTALE